MHEEEQAMLVERVEDLTNKLYVSEKSLRHFKERRLSRKAKLSSASSAASAAAAAQVTAAAATAASTTATESA